MSDLNQPTRYFRGLQPGAFMRLEHAASLKGLLKPFNRPLKKCSSNASRSWISKKQVAQTRLRNECEGHFGLFAGRFARFGRTYPTAHA